mgnify:CR=1 FL=1
MTANTNKNVIEDNLIAFDVLSGAGSIFNQNIDVYEKGEQDKPALKIRDRASTTLPPAKKMDYQIKESKNTKGGKLPDLFVP